MKTENSNTFKQIQNGKIETITRIDGQRPRFITLIIMFVILITTSGFNVVSASSTQRTNPKPLSALCLEQYHLGFKQLRVGDTQLKKVVIENCGSSSLTIHNATITGADATEFVLAENPADVVLPGNKKCYIEAAFRPKKLRNGKRTGQLNIYSSSNQARVTMTGTAKIPDGLGSKQPPLSVPNNIPPCKPRKPYGLVCLVNQTGVAINYSYKWGKGDWRSTNVRANGNRYHWWEYELGSHSSPKFFVRFDANLKSGTNHKQYVLTRYQAADTTCWAGKVYMFKKDGRNAIDLFDPDK